MQQSASRGLRGYAALSFAFWTICGVMSFSEHRAPTFTIEPATKVIFLNTSGESVHCAALGNPRPSISWVQADGTLVQDLPGLRLALANGTLLFLPFSAESYRQDIHASTYRCIASNLVGKISSRDIRIRAVVRQGYQVQVYDEFVIRGNTAVLRCQVPSIVRDYVIVTTWEREDGVTIVSNVANERDELWEELSSKLNNQTFGPKKTTFQWRRVWTDLKSEVKDKLAEINKKRQRGCTDEILNPCHKKVAILLAKASSQCAFIEKKGLTVSVIAEQERDVGVKNEESSIFYNADNTSRISQPIVVTLNSLRNPSTTNESRNLVKCELSAANDSSDPETCIPPPLPPQNISDVPLTQNVNNIEEPSIVEETVPLTVPVFNRTRPKIRRRRHHRTEDAQLTNLVEAEKEKSNMLQAIADAISASNQSKKERLRIDEERNRLIQERNVIENERNEIFRSLLQHLVSKEVI